MYLHVEKEVDSNKKNTLSKEEISFFVLFKLLRIDRLDQSIRQCS